MVFFFYKTNKIIVQRSRGGQGRSGQVRSTRSIPADEKRRERKTYALVVEDEGKDFKEILNSVKSKIGSDSTGDAINQQMIAQILLADDQVVRLIDTGGANPFKRRGDLVWS
jgi:hypothetical protein